MIGIRKVSISYGGESVLKNVSFPIAKGEHIAIMGPSGCGKTSLMKAIAGLLQPEKGSVSLGGKVSCVFQEPRLLPWLTALENINVVLSDSAATLPEAQKWLEAVELGDSADKLPFELSGGMQQRVNIARALAYSGDILLLDEPLKGMDAELRERVAELIRGEYEGKSLVIITHDEAEARAFADKIYVYRDKNFYLE